MFDRRLVVLLGDQDTDPNASGLRTTTEANAQGPHRFARGQFFFNEGKAEAAARSTAFQWDMGFVRGVGHSGSSMAVPAAERFRFARNDPPPPVVDFGFEDSAGTGLSETVDSVSRLSWSVDIDGVVVDGMGHLDVGYAMDGPTDASLELPPGLWIDGQQTGFARMVVELAPWTFAGSQLNEEIRFGFGSGSATDVTAQVYLERVADDQVALRAVALGTGGTSSGLVSVFDAVETDPVRITIDLDTIGDTYQVLYQVGDEPEYVFFSGDVASYRIGRFLQLSFDQYFNDPGEDFRIASYQVQFSPWIPGDANRDNRVDEEDAAALAAHWGQSGGWVYGDFDGDGVVGPADASILAAHWGYGVPSGEAGPLGNVPEPGMLTLLLTLGAVMLAARRRRKGHNA